MNFNILKTGFIEYLEKLNTQNKGGEEYDVENLEKSIFLYSKEFKDYIEDLKLTEEDTFESMEELTSSEVITELLAEINATEEELSNIDTTEEAPVEDEIEEEQPEENEDESMLLGIISDLFQDEEFKALVDENENGTIEEEELLNLLNTIKSNDENEDNLSLEDIINAGEDFSKEELEITTPETTQESVINEVAQTAAAKGYAGGGGGSSYVNNSSNTSTTKNIENMNSDQLKQEVGKKETTLKEKQDAVTAIQEGTNKELETLKEKAETSFENYMTQLEALEPQKAEQMRALVENKETIDNNNITIENHKATIANLDNTLANISSRRATLDSKASELKGAKSQDNTPEQNEAIEAQIREIETEKSKLDAEEKTANDDKIKAQKEIEELEKQNNELQIEGTTIEEEIAKLEEEIIKIENEDLQSAKEQYEIDKSAYESKKEELVSSAQKEVEVAAQELSKTQAELTKRLEEEAQWKYSPNGMTNLTKNAVELAYTQLGIYEDRGDNLGTMEKYGAGAGNPWCAAFVSWLYGKGQDGAKSPLNFTASVSNIREQAQQAGYYSQVGTYTPVPGDIMIQKSNGASHTGIVVGYDGEYVYTIEGNSSNAVRERKYKVGSGEYGKISGWVRMNEWTGGSSNISTTTYLANNNSEDADKEKRSTL